MANGSCLSETSRKAPDDGTGMGREGQHPHVAVKPLVDLATKKADSLDQLPLNGWLTHENHLYQAAKPEAPLADGGLETNMKLHRLKPSDLFGVTDQ